MAAARSAARETLNKMFSHDPEDRHAARGVLLGPTNALNKLMATTEAFEQEAAFVLAKQREDAQALLEASSASAAHAPRRARGQPSQSSPRSSTSSRPTRPSPS